MDGINKKVRSALYHTGLTGHGIDLTSATNTAIQIDGANITINPHRLERCLHQHFNAYLKELNDVGKTVLRENFEKRFDYLSKPERQTPPTSQEKATRS